MFPLKKVTEGMGEEQKKKPRVERIADGLRGWGIVLLGLSVAGSCYFVEDEEKQDWGSFFTVWGFGFLAWLFCHAARYILEDVTSDDMRKKEPNVAGRIGQVAYWLGSVAGILSAPVGVFAWIEEGHLKDPADSILALLVCLAIGAAAWLVGRGTRYILKGD